MRPSSSSLAIASARISRSVRSEKLRIGANVADATAPSSGKRNDENASQPLSGTVRWASGSWDGGVVVHVTSWPDSSAYALTQEGTNIGRHGAWSFPPRHGRAWPGHPRLTVLKRWKSWMAGTRP